MTLLAAFVLTVLPGLPGIAVGLCIAALVFIIFKDA
jgi:hypothetical protein